MKKSILVMIVSMIGFSATSQTEAETAIEHVIVGFAKAADQNDAEKLDTYLDSNYRIVMNRLFGSSEVTITPRDVYLEKIKSKEWGGDEREIKIHSITVNGETASAHVSLIGKKATFISIFTLVKNADNKWKLISDTPIIGS